VVHDDRADADEGAVADGAAMQHRLMADGDVLAERERDTGVDVQDCASWMLLRSPMVMMSLSPRTTALYQTLAWWCRITVPITEALCAMNHSSPRNTTLRSPSE